MYLFYHLSHVCIVETCAYLEHLCFMPAGMHLFMLSHSANYVLAGWPIREGYKRSNTVNMYRTEVDEKIIHERSSRNLPSISLILSVISPFHFLLSLSLPHLHSPREKLWYDAHTNNQKTTVREHKQFLQPCIKEHPKMVLFGLFILSVTKIPS